MITPYFVDDSVTLYHGDALAKLAVAAALDGCEIREEWGHVDRLRRLVITTPPEDVPTETPTKGGGQQ